VHRIDSAILREEARLASSGEEMSDPSFRLDPLKTRRTVSNCVTILNITVSLSIPLPVPQMGLSWFMAGVWFLISLT
jgi:hypothetical protein